MSRSPNSNGQTSIEFMAMLIFVMIAFSAFYTLFLEQQLEVREEREVQTAKAIADRVAFELNMALVQGDGYARNMTLPRGVAGDTYSVNLDQGTIILGWSDRTVVAQTAVDSVTGTIQPGPNTLQNNGGAISVSQ